MKTAPTLVLTWLCGALLAQQNATLTLPFGSALDADQQIVESQQLAKQVLSAPNPQGRVKGDQHRTYNFPAAKKDMLYRLYVPTTWDGQSSLPLIVMLHGAGSDENRYMDSNNKQLIRLAERHGYVVASPLGYSTLGAYGTPLRLPAVFGQPEAAAKQRSAVTPEAEHTLELSVLHLTTKRRVRTRDFAGTNASRPGAGPAKRQTARPAGDGGATCC